MVPGCWVVFLVFQLLVRRFALFKPVPFRRRIRPSTNCFPSCRGIVNAFGVYQTYYEMDLLSGESPSNISWIGSIQAFLLMIIGVMTGPIYDAGHFQALVRTGSFLVVFGIMMTSLCTRYWEVMLAQGICIGLGSGCLFVPSVAILPQYFTTKKAFANGIAASGSSLGKYFYRHLRGLELISPSRSRWHHLSHRLPAARATNWFCLGNTCSWLPGAGPFCHLPFSHADQGPPARKTCLSRASCISGTTIYPIYS